MINFIKKRRVWYLISLIVIGFGLVGMINNYRTQQHIFNLGIDFTGGTSLILRFNHVSDVMETQLREALLSVGLEKHIIQMSNHSDIIIKTIEMNVRIRNQLFDAIRSGVGPFDVMEVDVIGPSIGEELKKTSLIIILAVSIAILLYCSWRFEWIFGLASIIALLHDALIIMGMSALFDIEVNTVFIAALLTVLGYSINDTIVIFDRIREKLGASEDEGLSKSILNRAVNEMLPRSVHTSITTGMVVFALFFFAGVSLNVFSTVLLIGLITGTYSSLFIASPMVLTISKWRGVTVVK